MSQRLLANLGIAFPYLTSDTLDNCVILWLHEPKALGGGIIAQLAITKKQMPEIELIKLWLDNQDITWNAGDRGDFIKQTMENLQAYYVKEAII